MSEPMALQIANPSVVAKVERLANAMGSTKTAAVERAVDQLLREFEGSGDGTNRLRALLAQLDRVPERPDAHDPVLWDEQGLPR